MSANVDQRSKGQPNQVSNGISKDVMKEEDTTYMPPPQHAMRTWNEQPSETTYGAPPVSTMSVSDSFFQSYYPSNITYPFMGQGIGGSEGPWSNGADAMFNMGYDYSNVYGSFGFPFNNWDYANDYHWGPSQPPVRKDQRGYTAEEYYTPEMIPAETYGMMNGAAVMPEQQEPVGTIEQGIRAMTITSSNSTVMDTSSRKKVVDLSHPPVMSDSFGAGDATHMMSSHSHSVHSASFGGGGGGHGQSKKTTSWAAIASQPARPQQQPLRPRTIPRAPVNQNRPHNMDIGTWDIRGNPTKTVILSPQQPSSQPPQPRQNWVTSSVRSPRQAVTHSISGPNIDCSSSSSNNSSSSGHNPSGPVIISSQSNAYSNYNDTTDVAPVPREDNSSATTNGDSQNNTSVLDQLKSSNLYNPKDFNLNPRSARFFIIKSYSEDDIHRSIKYNIWCSTDHGNKRLDSAFREREGKGPLYLIFSVNGSGHFCGIAQMMSPVDYNKTAGVWAQDKWKGQFTVKWVYVKDVPNSQLRHIRLENNENKPVTNSRDTQEVPPEKGKQVLRIVHSYKHTTSIFDDFIHYEKRQEEDACSNVQARDSRNDSRGDHRGGDRGDHRGGDRIDNRGVDRIDNRGGDRMDNRGGDRMDHRGGDRMDNRGGDRMDNRGGDRMDNRGGDRDHRGGDRDRGDGQMARNRDNRRGGHERGGNEGTSRGGRQN